MPLQILDDSERRTLELSGSKLFYTLCGWGEYQTVRRSSRDDRTLIVDEIAVTCTIVERHTVAWENVLDSQGDALPFSIEALGHLAPQIIQVLYGLIIAGVVQEGEDSENSESSSST